MLRGQKGNYGFPPEQQPHSELTIPMWKTNASVPNYLGTIERPNKLFMNKSGPIEFPLFSRLYKDVENVWIQDKKKQPDCYLTINTPTKFKEVFIRQPETRNVSQPFSLRPTRY